jgi:ATP/maltotriose-dependent transcriptional regulator MalT
MSMLEQSKNFAAGDAAFAVDQAGTITCWNKSAEKNLGHTASGALGQKCWKLLSGNDVYGNRYCSKNCQLRKMAFNHERVNGFKVSYKTAPDTRQEFAVSYLTASNQSGNELLLHICRPGKIVSEVINNHPATIPSSNQLIKPLTPRETETLKLLAGGRSASEIASTMSICAATVCNHIQHVLYKMHVHSRLEAVLLGKQLDLI